MIEFVWEGPHAARAWLAIAPLVRISRRPFEMSSADLVMF